MKKLFMIIAVTIFMTACGTGVDTKTMKDSVAVTTTVVTDTLKKVETSVTVTPVAPIVKK